MQEKRNMELLAQALKKELELAGLWQKKAPAWVTGYDEHHLFQTDFAQWLQFVFLPNQLIQAFSLPESPHLLMVPQAIKYYGTDIQKGKILEIFIEIDAG